MNNLTYFNYSYICTSTILCYNYKKQKIKTHIKLSQAKLELF